MRLFFAFLVSLAIIASPASAQTFSGVPSLADPFRLNDLSPAHSNGYSDLTGKVEIAPPSAGRRVLIIATGQSNIGNPVATAYSPANPNSIYNLNVFSGGVYKLADPVLGAGGPGASFTTILADTLIADGKAASVVVENISVGSTLAADWAPDGLAYHRIAVAAARYLSKTNYTPTFCFILRHQGESDTNAGTSQAAYTASLTPELAQWRALLPSCIIFVAQVSFFNTITSAGIIAAQAAAVNGSTILSLGNFDSIGCGGRSAECIDYNATGNAAAAAIAKVPIEAWLDAH